MYNCPYCKVQRFYDLSDVRRHIAKNHPNKEENEAFLDNALRHVVYEDSTPTISVDISSDSSDSFSGGGGDFGGGGSSGSWD